MKFRKKFFQEGNLDPILADFVGGTHNDKPNVQRERNNLIKKILSQLEEALKIEVASFWKMSFHLIGG